MTSDTARYLEEQLPRFRAELYDFLRIPSVSAKAEHDQDTRATAVWFKDRLTEAGLEASVLETPGHPVVLG